MLWNARRDRRTCASSSIRCCTTRDLLATGGPGSIFEGNSDAVNPGARCRADRLGLEGSKSRNRLSETLAWPAFFMGQEVSHEAGAAVRPMGSAAGLWPALGAAALRHCNARHPGALPGLHGGVQQEGRRQDYVVLRARLRPVRL